MDVAAGEYGYDAVYFRRMLDAQAVDVLQADATRCAGATGFMRVDALCAAYELPLSAHCGPAIHLHLCCAATRLRHLEYFHDHARIDHMIFDGVPEPRDGCLAPDLSRPGNGLDVQAGGRQQMAGPDLTLGASRFHDHESSRTFVSRKGRYI